METNTTAVAFQLIAGRIVVLRSIPLSLISSSPVSFRLLRHPVMIRKLFFLIMTHAVLVSWLSSGRRSVARSSSSTSAGRLYLARAFSTTRLAPRTHVWSVQHENNNNKHGRFLTSTTGRRFMSTIQDEEQDLDAALDSILGDHQAAAQQQQSSTKPTTTRLRIEKKPILEGGEQHRGAPMPPTLVEQVRCMLVWCGSNGSVVACLEFSLELNSPCISLSLSFFFKQNTGRSH